MEAGTQSALLIVWALFWMLILSLMMVHPMFRATRIQVRRSLRLNLNRWRAARHRMRGHMLRFWGRCNMRVGKTLLWLAQGLEEGFSPPAWFRLLMRLAGHSIYYYTAVHLVFQQPVAWWYPAVYAAFAGIMDSIYQRWKRYRQRRAAAASGSSATMKPASKQSAKL